jgi:hypothetical protein
MRIRVYPDGFSPQRYLSSPPQSLPVQIAKREAKLYARVLAKRGDLARASTTFVVIRLPNNTRIYEWFAEGARMADVYEFARYHFPRIQGLPFSLMKEDGAIFLDDCAEVLPFCPTSELQLCLQIRGF